MKKVFLIILTLLLITACGKNSTKETYNGTATDLSKKYLSKGTIINIYRGTEELSDSLEDAGKAYITMTFNVITDLYFNIDYNDTNNYIVEKKISNVLITKTPKMGLAEEIYVNYGLYDHGSELKGSNNSYTIKYDNPLNYGDQTSLAVKINKIALLDSTKYDYNATPTTGQIYSDLGITRENVELTLSFRIELKTKEGKILYKDYNVVMPPVNYDITGTEYQINTETEDVTKMETFLEK